MQATADPPELLEIRAQRRRADQSRKPMSYEHLRLERDGAVATITIDRQRVLNALNTGVIDDLRHAALEARHDAAVRALIITGAGDKAFVAGADINELARLTPHRCVAVSVAGNSVRAGGGARADDLSLDEP